MRPCLREAQVRSTRTPGPQVGLPHSLSCCHLTSLPERPTTAASLPRAVGLPAGRGGKAPAAEPGRLEVVRTGRNMPKPGKRRLPLLTLALVLTMFAQSLQTLHASPAK